jgi:hypothetical protein
MDAEQELFQAAPCQLSKATLQNGQPQPKVLNEKSFLQGR